MKTPVESVTLLDSMAGIAKNSLLKATDSGSVPRPVELEWIVIAVDESLFAPTSVLRTPTYADIFASPRVSRSVNSAEFRSGPRRCFQLGRVSIQEAFPGPPMPYYYFRIVTGNSSGQFEMNYGEGWFPRETGSYILVPPGTQCEMRGNCRGDFESLILAFPETELQQLAGEQLEAEGGHLRRPPSKEGHDPYLSTLMQQLWAQSSPQCLGSEIMLEGMFITFLGRLLALGERRTPPPQINQKGAEKIVRETTDYLRANLAAKVSLVDIAAATQISCSHLTRVFKKTTGRTVHDYLLELRVNRAKELITYFGRNLTLAEIASQCGFANHGHLTQAFTQMVGVTPQQFRLQS